MSSRRLVTRIREARRERGWSQAELARRAGLSRAAVSALETERGVPSTAAALGLAEALGRRVEDLFELAAVRPATEWAWPPVDGSAGAWEAELGGRAWRIPLEPTHVGALAPDDTGGERSDSDPSRTIVVAGCDPAVGLLAERLRGGGYRLIPLVRSSTRALELAAAGRVHLAGVHLGDNARACATLGAGATRVRAASWELGLALAPGLGLRSAAAAVRADLRWVAREEGSGARRLQDRLLGRRRPRGLERVARDHAGVAEAVRAGWADAGVCVRLAALQAGVEFLAVEREAYDLVAAPALGDDPRVAAVIEALRSSDLRRALGAYAGYDTTETGEVEVSAAPENAEWAG